MHSKKRIANKMLGRAHHATLIAVLNALCAGHAVADGSGSISGRFVFETTDEAEQKMRPARNVLVYTYSDCVAGDDTSPTDEKIVNPKMVHLVNGTFDRRWCVKRVGDELIFKNAGNAPDVIDFFGEKIYHKSSLTIDRGEIRGFHLDVVAPHPVRVKSNLGYYILGNQPPCLLVILQRNDRYSLSDKDGRFSISHLKAGECTLRCLVSGGALAKGTNLDRGKLTVQIQENENVDVGDIRLDSSMRGPLD